MGEQPIWWYFATNETIAELCNASISAKASNAIINPSKATSPNATSTANGTNTTANMEPQLQTFLNESSWNKLNKSTDNNSTAMWARGSGGKVNRTSFNRTVVLIMALQRNFRLHANNSTTSNTSRLMPTMNGATANGANTTATNTTVATTAATINATTTAATTATTTTATTAANMFREMMAVDLDGAEC